MRYLALLLMLVAIPAIAQADYAGPVINTHLHINGNSPVSNILWQLKRTNTEYAILVPKYFKSIYRGDEPVIDSELEDFIKNNPNLFTLFGMQRTELCDSRLHNSDDYIANLIPKIKAALAKKYYVGVGEYLAKHFAYNPGKCAERDHPIDSKLLRAILSAIQDFDKPLLIHMEGHPDLVRDLGKLLTEFPKAKVVWAHNCGRSHPGVIRTMLSKHKNLFCDLANMGGGGPGYGIAWPRLESYTFLPADNYNKLVPEQRDLMNDFADRFMIATDEAHNNGQRSNIQYRRMSEMRDFLYQLKPEAREMIAYKNAIRIFSLPMPVTP